MATMLRRAGALVTTMLALLGVMSATGHASDEPRYRVDATLDPGARTISGTVEITLENAAPAPLEDVVLVLYPNCFARPDPGIDDLNRPYVLPHEEFVAGGM